MDPGGGASGPGHGLSNVPAFLTKLWTLVEDPQTDDLIRWSPGGTSFHVFDQGRFSKEVLPKFFKHNNMASFIRQLNMYGFRKVVHLEQGGLVKPERDDTEFQHPFFIRGQEVQLENIKRKVTAVPSVRQEEVKTADEVNRILTDVQVMKGKQETIDSRIHAMKQENAALWREVATLRQKHSQQQKVVNKLIQFLISLVQTNRLLGLKRKMPLMLDDGNSGHSLPKYNRPFSLEHLQSSLFPTDSSVSSGPIISDITDVATPIPEDEPSAVLGVVFTLLGPPSEQTVPLNVMYVLFCRTELVDHVDSIDSGLENLQNMLNSQTFTFDTSPILEFFSSPVTDFDLDCLDTVRNTITTIPGFPQGVKSLN
uniref:Heat shock transcription factor 1 n=1 Tax=Neogobius melanostomus TaxID=47308 RepID=A0A8C6U4E7_9GOBI